MPEDKGIKFGHLSNIPYKDEGDLPFISEKDLKKDPVTKLMSDFHTDMLRMDVEKDRDQLSNIWEGVEGGYNVIKSIKREWVPEEKTWMVLVEWGQLYRQGTTRAKKAMQNRYVSKHLK